MQVWSFEISFIFSKFLFTKWDRHVLKICFGPALSRTKELDPLRFLIWFGRNSSLLQSIVRICLNILTSKTSTVIGEKYLCKSNHWLYRCKVQIWTVLFDPKLGLNRFWTSLGSANWATNVQQIESWLYIVFL